MSGSDAQPKLDACGCCSAGTPAPAIYNRPGLSALNYRVGTYGTFLRRMLDSLRTQFVPGGPTLAALTTRAPDDPAIALLDACAVVADVLSFYEERIANENYLRTATERRSILELARAIGYELSPGVAASTYLAFTVETTPGLPDTLTIPTGTRVQSLPAPGKLPQTFETVEDISARVEWNQLKPRTSAAQDFRLGDTRAYLAGINTQLQPGDAILVVGDERVKTTGSENWDLRILESVAPNVDAGYTLVTWKNGLGYRSGGRVIQPAAENPKFYAFRQRAALFGYNAPNWKSLTDSIQKNYCTNTDPTTCTDWPNFQITTAQINANSIDLDAAYPKIIPDAWIALSKPQTPEDYVKLYRVARASITSRSDFTLSAKATRLVLDTNEHLGEFGLRETSVLAQSEELALAERPFCDAVTGDLADPVTSQDNSLAGSEIDLDSAVSGLQTGQALMLSGKWIRARVAPSATDLVLTSEDGSQTYALEPLDILQLLEPPAAADENWRWHLEDSKGNTGFVTASPGTILPHAATKDDPVASEVVFVDQAALSADGAFTVVKLKKSMTGVYDPATVSLSANVALATHGETVREVLGSGNGSQVNQQFALKRPPLTYVSAPTPSGARSTLEIRVNGIAWAEAPSLYGLGATDQKYIVRLANDGTPGITFGDGASGERLPTGQQNVTATYRTGIGPDGEVDASSLTLLQTRPAGVRSVTNPLPGSGAAAPENLGDARTNAPMTVLTLDRMVSLSDYEDFARVFAGIGKAQAVDLWNGEAHVIYICTAASNGDPLDPSIPLFTSLAAALEDFRDPVQRVQLAGYTRRTFGLQATVLVDSPRYVLDDVVAQVKEALLAGYSFVARDFGQPVTAAEILDTMQSIPGVVAVDLNDLSLDSTRQAPVISWRRFFLAVRILRRPIFIKSQAAPVPPVLTAQAASLVQGSFEPVELLLINPAEIRLEGKKA